MPIPLRKFVTLMHYVDANLYYDLVTGRSITGIMHIANKTPNDLYSKKQPTVETATSGSKFIAAWICVDQSIGLKNTLYYLGAPFARKLTCLGTTSQWLTALQLHMLSCTSNTYSIFSLVREAIAAAILHSTTLMEIRILLISPVSIEHLDQYEHKTSDHLLGDQGESCGQQSLRVECRKLRWLGLCFGG